MKGLLVVLALVALAVVGFVMFVRLGVSNVGDTDAPLTDTVRARVTDARFEDNYEFSQHRGYRVTYRYAVGTTRYTSQEWVPEEVWDGRADALVVCVSPDEPARHVVVTRVGARCGDDSVGIADVRQAEPVEVS